MKIAIASDHAGYPLKTSILEFLENHGYEVLDYGTNSTESCDYPVFGEKLGRAVAAGTVERGILICGTGVGIGIAANKVSGVRCVTCSDVYTAEMSREHNDTNVLSLGARVIGVGLAEKIVETWLTTEFMGERHARRVAMLNQINNADG